MIPRKNKQYKFLCNSCVELIYEEARMQQLELAAHQQDEWNMKNKKNDVDL